jgi:hypothetical protein
MENKIGTKFMYCNEIQISVVYKIVVRRAVLQKHGVGLLNVGKKCELLA